MSSEQVPLLKRIAGFFGLNASMGAMIALVVVVGLGEKMAERFLPLYLLALGGSRLRGRVPQRDGQPAVGPLLVSRRLGRRPHRLQARADPLYRSSRCSATSS